MKGIQQKIAAKGVGGHFRVYTAFYNAGKRAQLAGSCDYRQLIYAVLCNAVSKMPIPGAILVAAVAFVFHAANSLLFL